MKRYTGVLMLLVGLAVSTSAMAQTIFLESRGNNSTWGTTFSGKNSAGTTVNFGNSTAKSSLSSGTQPGSFYGTTTTTSCTAADPLRWRVQPTLPSTGTWLVEYTHTGSTASSDVLVNITQTGCSGLPTNTTVFSSAVANSWETIGTMEATSTTPTIEFIYASGNAHSQARWYLDTLRFTFIPSSPQRVWDGGGGDDNLGTAQNWVGDVAPVTGDGINFAGSTRVNPVLDNNYDLAGVRFYSGASAFTLSRASSELLTLSGSITNSSSNLQTFNVPLNLTAITPIIDVGSAGISINGDVTASALTKRGSGTLTLQNSGANSISGTLTISAGTVTLATANQLADSTVVSFASTGVLNIPAGISETIKRSADTGLASTGYIGTINLGNNSSVTMNGDASFSGATAGAAVRILGGSGSTFTFQGAGLTSEIRWTPSNLTNTYEKLVVNNGTLRLGHGGNAWLMPEAGLGAQPASFMQDQITLNSARLGINSSIAANPQGVTNTVYVHANRGMTLVGSNIFETFQNVQFPGKITGSGILNHNGGGDLELQSANDFTGPFYQGSGSVTLGHQGALGGTATLMLTDGTPTGAGVAASVPGLIVTNNLFLNAITNFFTTTANSTNFTVAGSVNMGAGGSQPRIDVRNANGVVTFAGPVFNSWGIHKIGPGKLSLANTANTFTGSNTVAAGTLGLAAMTSLPGDPDIFLTGSGTLEADDSFTVPSSRPITLLGAGGLSAVATKTLTVDAPVIGTAALSIKGLGTVILNDPSQYNGALTVSGNLVANQPLNITTLAGAGTIAMGANSITLTGSGNSTFSGSITGTGSMNKSGGGILTLSGSSAFSGGVTLNNARINFNNNNAAGTGTITIEGVSTISSSAPDVVLTNNIVLNPGAIATIYATSGNDLDLQGYITGSGSLYRDNTGAGATIISGSNDFSGGFLITSRAIRLGHKNALGTGTFTIGDAFAVPATGISIHGTANLSGVNAIQNPVTINQNFSMSGSNSVELAGPITLANHITLTANSSSTTSPTLSGTITGPGISLTEAGSATLTISNGDNDYDGGTTINGTVKVTNLSGSALGSGAVTVSSTGRLTGNGIVSGTVDLSGTISPGTSPGTITTGTQNWNGNAGYTFEVNNATGGAGSGWDLVSINGDLNINANTGSMFKINVTGLDGLGNIGTVANFSQSGSYDWVIAQVTGTINGFDPAAFSIITTNFAANLGLGSTFSVTTNPGNNQIILQYRVNGTQFTSLQRSGNNLTLSGVGGTPNATYYVLGSTDVGLPLINWTPIATNTFDGSGAFNYIHTINPAEPQLFYLISEPTEP